MHGSFGLEQPSEANDPVPGLGVGVGVGGLAALLIGKFTLTNISLVLLVILYGPDTALTPKTLDDHSQLAENGVVPPLKFTMVFHGEPGKPDNVAIVNPPAAVSSCETKQTANPPTDPAVALGQVHVVPLIELAELPIPDSLTGVIRSDPVNSKRLIPLKLPAGMLTKLKDVAAASAALAMRHQTCVVFGALLEV